MTVKEFNEKLDIVQVISDCIDLKKTGKDYSGLCPFHNDTKNPSLKVSVEKNIYKCFTCDVGGDAVDFYRRFKNIEIPQALEELAYKYNINYDNSNYDNPNYTPTAKLIECMKDATVFFQKTLWGNKKIIKYALEDRKLTKQSIMDFRIGFADEKFDSLYRHLKSLGHSDRVMLELGLIKKSERGIRDFFINRLIVPITNFGSAKVIAFGGRIISGNAPKYINSPESPLFKKRENLFACSDIKKIIADKGYSIVVEGYFDVISANQSGFTSTVAGLGTAFTEQQAELLDKISHNSILCFDNDNAGRKACDSAVVTMCNVGMNTKIIEIKDVKDIDEVLCRDNGKNLFLEYVKNSISGVKYLANRKFGEKSDDYNYIMDRLRQSKETYNVLQGIHKEEFIKELEEKTGYDKSIIVQELNKISNAERRKIEKEEEKKEEDIKKAKKIINNLLSEISCRTSKFKYQCLINNSTDIEFLRRVYKEVLTLKK